jgi:hypothetical protein
MDFQTVILEIGRPSAPDAPAGGSWLAQMTSRFIRSSRQFLKKFPTQCTLHPRSLQPPTRRRPPVLILARRDHPLSSRRGQRMPSSPQAGWSLPACSSQQPERSLPARISRSACPAHRGWDGTRLHAARDALDGTRLRTNIVWRPAAAFSIGVASSALWVSSTLVNSTCRRAFILPSSKEMLR